AHVARAGRGGARPPLARRRRHGARHQGPAAHAHPHGGARGVRGLGRGRYRGGVGGDGARGRGIGARGGASGELRGRRRSGKVGRRHRVTHGSAGNARGALRSTRETQKGRAALREQGAGSGRSSGVSYSLLPAPSQRQLSPTPMTTPSTVSSLEPPPRTAWSIRYATLASKG